MSKNHIPIASKPEISMVGKSRKIDRKIARAKMRKEGITQMNKEKFGVQGQMILRLPSFFAAHWREYAAK